MNIKKKGGVEVSPESNLHHADECWFLSFIYSERLDSPPRHLQHSTCKHIREVIGGTLEDMRLAANARLGGGEHQSALRCSEVSVSSADARSAAAAAAGGDTNPSIVKKVSLAQTWSNKVDPKGWLLSEK